MIVSTGNRQVKELLRLKKKSGARMEAGVFLAEGARIVSEAPKDRIKKIYISESYLRAQGGSLASRGICFEAMSDAVFSHVSGTKTPQGIMAVVGRPDYDMADILKRGIPHILVLDGIQDPGNLGTIFRTAEAAGATGIIMGNDCVDIFNPKAVRSTMGAVYRMPFLYADDILKAAEALKENKIRLYAAHLRGERAYDEEDYTTASAIMIGNEGNGLKAPLAGLADARVSIPMEGAAESLNAAAAAAVLMYEVKRQRKRG